MSIFAIADDIVSKYVSGEGVHLPTLESTPEGQAAWRIFDMASKQVAKNLKLSLDIEVAPTHEKAVRQVIKAYRQLTLGRWNKSPSDALQVESSYQTKEQADVAADVFAYCGVRINRVDDRKISMDIGSHSRWARQEAQGISAGG